MFPTAIQGVRHDVLTMEILLGASRVNVGYFCADHADNNTINGHFYILPEFRNKEVLTEVVKGFPASASMYMQRVNKSVMVSSCDYKDVAVKRMFDDFGFESRAHWIARKEFKI